MAQSPIQGSLGMVLPLWHHLSGSKDHRAGELFQTSLMSALIAGIYEGEATYGELRKHGDFGLGTFNDLDGEMVGFDGTFYQLRSDGSARPVTADQKTPFAVVTFSQPEQELDETQTVTKSELLALIEKATDANLFSAVRVDGIFIEVRTRTVQTSGQALSSAHRSSETSSGENLHQRPGHPGWIPYARVCSGHRCGRLSPALPAEG